MPVCLDTLLIGLYVLADDLLQPRKGPGRPPRITDPELVCLAVAQVLLDRPGDRKFLALARYRLGHLFPYLPKQPGDNKRLRALAPDICALINVIAFESESLDDRVRLLEDAGALRSITRDRQALGARGDRQLRLLPLAAPLFLGHEARARLLPRRDADRLRARAGEHARAPRPPPR